MAVHRCCNKEKVKKGLWSPEEDEKLVRYITSHGHISWTSLPKRAGLERCGKSCRLRWINYLKPEVKRGSFTSEEEQIIIDCHRILGNRWARIAKHLPGRTDNEVKNFWNSCIKKKLIAQGLDPRTHNLLKTPKNNSIPRTQKHRTSSVEVDSLKNPRRAKGTLPLTAPAPPLAPIITTLPLVHSQVVEIPEGEKLNLVLPNRDLQSDTITNLDCGSFSTVQQSSCSSLPNQSHSRLFDTKVSSNQTIQSSDIGSENQGHNQKWILGQGGVTMRSTGGISVGIENSSCFEMENNTESTLNESALIDFLLFESTFMCRPMCDDLIYTDSMTWNFD